MLYMQKRSVPNCGYLLTGSANTNGPGTCTGHYKINLAHQIHQQITNTTTANRGWVQVTENRQTVWKYYNDNGALIKNQWFQSPASGIWYYFDRNGNMGDRLGQMRER